jgi:CheY-like chemotaxis protein
MNEQPTGRPQPAPQRSRILVVDDNPDAAECLGLLLELTGHEVRVAHDGWAALEAARDYQPDAVILDIGLPGLNGYEVARRLRAQPQTRGILLLAVSGWGEEEDFRRSREAGIDHHLVKPANLAKLQQLLAEPRPAKMP